jgi:4-alpha-glucanotransferase
MLNQRCSGILLHPTSLPSRYGIGDLGEGAFQFIDFLADSDQSIWQILPLGPTGYGNSPYLCYSALAINPWLISPEKLVEVGLLFADSLDHAPEFNTPYVDYDAAIAYKSQLLKQAFASFTSRPDPDLTQAFDDFCEAQADWLTDYALFMALKEAHGGAGWHTWDKAIAWREPEALATWSQRLKTEILYHQFVQFIGFRQWQAVKQYANQRHVAIFGDLPIYVAHDSADVWANPENFCLDPETGAAAMMAGVPPDYFSETGQLWGNPVYNWETLQSTDFAWWVNRFKALLQYLDIVRVDHFRGFESYWGVPEGETTAQYGDWYPAPGREFFQVLRERLGDNLPIVAEDLGVITPEVEALRDDFGFPGMKILHFAFDSDRANVFLPFNYTNRNAIVYTGTHDNDTTVGWFDGRSPEQQQTVINYLGCVCSEGIQWSLIRLASSSVANVAIFPLQDILGLGNDARMNLPGTAEGNWGWRYHPDQLTPGLAGHLSFITEMYGRRIYHPEPQPSPPSAEED